MLLKDKVCIVAGAGSLRGIGYAVVELFAEHGAKVVALDVAMDTAREQQIKTRVDQHTGRDTNFIGVRCDISNANDCEQAVTEVLARHGTIDCLVNSAGIVKAQSFMEITDSDYDSIMEVNLKGCYLLCRAVLRVFEARAGGVIVNLASSAAQRGGGLVGGAHYAASKGGVISLTRTIAREYGPKGIRANIVCPAMIDTAMLDGLSAQKLAQIVEAVPLGRTGTTREAAGACLFLASDLSGFVTGATIDVNGGSHIH